MLTGFICSFFWLRVNHFLFILSAFDDRLPLSSAYSGLVWFWLLVQSHDIRNWNFRSLHSGMFGIIYLISILVWIFSERDLFQVTGTSSVLYIFVSVHNLWVSHTLFLPIAPGFCKVGITLCRFLLHRPLFLGVFHNSFTSAFSLSCTDLSKVSTEDSDHGIP